MRPKAKEKESTTQKTIKKVAYTPPPIMRNGKRVLIPTPEERYEVVSLAIMQGNVERLNERERKLYDRLHAAYNIICETPIKGQAVKKLMDLYPNINEAYAYKDIDYAIRIWNPKTRLDREFLESVMVDALLENIKNPNSDEGSRAKNLATLQRYISSLPQEPADPTLMQKHNIYIQLNYNGDTINIPYSQGKLPNAPKREVAAMLDDEITDVEAEEIIES